ncbi:MAG: DUF3372 domain-containing protein [Gammaproteobacteria bacterium]|nr:DUF3372 domain-containing protein [Gammaproteobacteria bacterium]
MLLSAFLTACGGSDDDGGILDNGGDEPLQCTAPQVPNSDGTACVTPETPETNTAPTISSGSTITVTEGAENGSTVYTAAASDAEGDSLSWTITDSESIFAIDSSSGAITVADNSNLVADSLSNYQITVTVSDGELEASQVISVTVESTGSSAPTPSQVPGTNEAVIYYYRADDNYTGWTIHAWNNDTCSGYADFAADGGTEWSAGLIHDGVDDNYGAYWLIDTTANASCLNYIVHKGDSKDPDGDQKLDLTQSRWNFVVSESGIYTDPEDISFDVPFSIDGASAHLIDASTIVWYGSATSNVYLVSSATGDLDAALTVTDSNSIELSPTTLTAAQKAIVPHLTDTNSWTAYTFDAELDDVKSLLKTQLALVSTAADDSLTSATYVQTAKALDAIYTTGDNDADEQTLGIQYVDGGLTVSVWAPTAIDVNLKVYNASKSLSSTEEMTYDAATGIWSYTTADASALDRMFYRFEVNVYHPATKAVETLWSTDPYSVNTSTNGLYSQFVNMTDVDITPADWGAYDIPTISNIEDAVILETHIRDFSVFDDTTTAANRGKYLAFTESSSDAVQHLQGLADSGVTHFHMLPANDIATIEEDESKRIDLTNTVDELCARVSDAPVCGVENGSDTLLTVLESYDPASGDAQALIKKVQGLDGFNWGYDPHHFNVVEGSYASDPDGVTRIKEFREMVKALHQTGMRVALDVVYNHTSSSGVNDKSVFDKLVPGYYHRYSEVTGEMERSTCCENTATEHRMMGKFVVDSLAFWAEHYAIDSFRFDVMGHMPKDVILDGRDAVAAIDPDTYFYGEGWNWGEVVDNRLFEQATQYNMADSEVGTFNDRPRDTIRWAPLAQDDVNLSNVDHIRLGLAGTLQNYELKDKDGVRKLGKNFAQSSYALDPADIINYVSKHDNETLWDQLQYSLPTDMSAEDRARIHNISAAIPVLSQGIPFFQLGVEMMRSKSMDRNTYDAGDWFNRVDYTNMTNNWNVGWPLEQDNSAKYSLIKPLSANTNIAVTGTDIDFTEDVFNEFLQIRSSSPLFRLTTEQDIIDRVGFHNTGASQTEGIIVMSLDDGTGVADLDSNYDAIVVVINGTDSEETMTVKSATGFTLHPVHANSIDAMVAAASFTPNANDAANGDFTVGAYTAAVFVKVQSGGQGDGVPADPDFVASPYGETDIAVVGSGDWSDSVALSYNNEGLYSATTTLSAGTYVFSIGDANLTTVDLGFADVAADTDSLALSDSAGEIAFTASSSGTYGFELDVSSSTPVLKVSLLNALVSCDAPVSAGDAPFDIAGNGSLYIKGDHSGWGADEAYILTYIGNNQYKAIAEFDGTFNFKLASSDGDWATQLWVQNSDGSINTSSLEVGTTYDVAYGNAGTDNNSMTVAQGEYSFTLTLNDANPAAETKPAGTLLVEQCSQ